MSVIGPIPQSNHAPILRVAVVIVPWVAVESERYAESSVITVPWREDYIALGAKIDEGKGARPIVRLLAVIANRFVL
jgi:hypothetical protein